MATATHPTREEWAARQAGLPPAARAALAEAAVRANALAGEARREREARANRERQYRFDYEAALADALVVAGAEWLAAYRVPDSGVKGLPVFDLGTLAFSAMFDPRAIGVWPIYLALRWDDVDRVSGWYPWPGCSPWTVGKPGDCRPFAHFADALAFATLPAETPF